MQKTPWVKPQSGFTSDFIRPKNTAPTSSQGSKKGKNKQSTPDVPKSKDVRRLEELIRQCSSATGLEKSRKGGCFCLARTHPLSTYTPLCTSCGLILCSVNQPYHCCPHCAKALLSPTGLNDLISQLDAQLATTLVQEEESRQRQVEQARREAGAFPSLPGGPQSQPPPTTTTTTRPNPQPQVTYTHKVLSLTGASNRRKVVVSSYHSSPTPPNTSQPPSRDEPLSELLEPERVPPPPPETIHANLQPSKDRPFENLVQGGGGGVIYVPTNKVAHQAQSGRAGAAGAGGAGSRAKGKRKEREKEKQVESQK